MGWMTPGVRDPYAKVKSANELAGRDAAALGRYGQGFLEKGYQGALDQYGGAQTALDSMRGGLSGPGYLEQLYQQRQQGTDPYYNRLRETGLARLGQAAAARGKFNSGGAMAGEGTYLADLAAKESHDMAGLAGGASQERSDRYKSVFDASQQLGGAKAGLQERSTLGQWATLSEGEKAHIQQQLAAAGVDLSKYRDDEQMLLGVLGILGSVGGTAFGSRGRGAGGGGGGGSGAG